MPHVTEDAIVWQGETVFVTHDPRQSADTGPYAVCVSGLTHAIIVGRTADRARAIRCAQRVNRYPAQARAFAGL